jgi:hypothetical protein
MTRRDPWTIHPPTRPVPLLAMIERYARVAARRVSARSRWVRPRTLLPLTPDRIAAGGAGLVLLLTVTALVGALAAQAAWAAGRSGVTSAVRMSQTAQLIYSRLADADTAAGALFLGAPAAPVEVALGDLYARAKTDVDAALGEAIRDTEGDPGRLRSLARIAAQLPVYTGLVDAAVALRIRSVTEPGGRVVSGGLLAAAYLREASTYLRHTLLPAARRLWDDERARLDRSRRSASLGLAGTLLLSVLCVAGLLVAQVRLTGLTNRLINPGLALATVAMVAGLSWTGWAWHRWPTTQARLTDVQAALATPESLANLKMVALRARTDDILRLGANGDAAALTADFNSAFDELVWAPGRCQNAGSRPAGTDQLAALRAHQSVVPAEELDALVRIAITWCTDHEREIVANELTGDPLAHRAAIASAQPPDGRTARDFAALDSGLETAIGRGNAALAARADRVPPAPPGLAWASGLSCLVAALSSAAGLWLRAREYR